MPLAAAAAAITADDRLILKLPEQHLEATKKSVQAAQGPQARLATGAHSTRCCQVLLRRSAEMANKEVIPDPAEVSQDLHGRVVAFALSAAAAMHGRAAGLGEPRL